MDYIEISFTLSEKNPFSDIVVAKLNELEFESYVELIRTKSEQIGLQFVSHKNKWNLLYFKK